MRAVSTILPFAAWLLALASPASATSLVLQIAAGQAPQQQPQDAAQAGQVLLASMPVWTHATLEAGDGRLFVSAPVTASGRLVFHNVTAGSYLGEVQCATHVFPPLRVDVPADGDDAATEITVTETFRGNDWDNRGPALPRVGDASAAAAAAVPTFVVTPITTQLRNFYAVRESFSVLTLLKNPMILMGMFGLLIMFGLPYIMDNMDPEMRAEYEERQKTSPMNNILAGGGPTPGSNFDMAAFLAGTNTKSGSDSAANAGSAGGAGGSKNNNRNQGGRR